MGPAPRIIIVLMSVRFFTSFPVFHASKGGGVISAFSGAATARSTCKGGSRPPLVLRPTHTVRLGMHFPDGAEVCLGRHRPPRAALLPISAATSLPAMLLLLRAESAAQDLVATARDLLVTSTCSRGNQIQKAALSFHSNLFLQQQQISQLCPQLRHYWDRSCATMVPPPMLCRQASDHECR